MKNIKIVETVWDIKSLYKEANTPARRALAGYMLQTGKTNDVILGGAFSLLRDIESCKGKVYRLESGTTPRNEKLIISNVELAIGGGLNKFALKEREIRKTLKRINDYV